MKKILTLLLLIFPILIFAILNISATIIGWMVPQPTERVEVSRDGVHYAQQIEINYSNVDTETTYELSYKVMPKGSRNKEVEVFVSDEDQVQILTIGAANDDGIGVITYKVLNFGFSEITVKSKDGGYKSNAYVVAENNELGKDFLQGAVFEFNELSDGDLKFGYTNDVKVKFRYYPKELTKENLVSETRSFSLSKYASIISANNGIGEVLVNLSGYHAEYPDKTTYELSIRREADDTPGAKKSKLKTSFKMNINPGYNLRFVDPSSLKKEEADDQMEIMKMYLAGEHTVYQIDDILIKDSIVLKNNAKLYGNHKTIKISSDFTHGNAVNLYDNASLEAVHIQGSLNEYKGQRIPYEGLNNVYMQATEKTRKMSIKNSVIEAGRYNVVLKGKSYEEGSLLKPTLFEIYDVKFNAALVAAINVDNAKEDGYKINSTDVRVKNLSFEWASAGIILQNGSGLRGWAKLTVLEKDRNDITSSLDMTNNWRNLEEAYGVLKAFNATDVVKDMIKAYPDAFAYEKPYYYVAMLIVKRGGGDNQSQVIIEDNYLKDNVRMAIKVPSSIEALHEKIGGRAPFEFYCLDGKTKPKQPNN